MEYLTVGKANPQITVKKFGIYTILIFLINSIINYLQSSGQPVLDMTVKSVLIAGGLAIINYLKHIK